MKKFTRFVSLFIVITVVFMLIMSESSVAAFRNVKLGEDAPKFSLKEIDSNNAVSLESFFNKNEVIVLVFWATWSPRSQEELAELQKLVSEYKDKKVAVVAVNVEKEEPTEEEYAKMKEIKDTLKVEFSLLLDAGLITFNEYGVVAVPSTVILDKSGIIKKIYDGYPTSARYDMKDDVEIMLGLKEPEKETQVAEAKGPKILKAAKLHYGMGRKLVERGMGIKAVKELEKSASLDANYDLPLVLMGEVYEKESNRVKGKQKKAANLEKAVESFKRALERNGENLFAHSGLVRVYAYQGNLTDADEAMKTALNIDSNFLTVIVAHGILLQAKDKDEEAIKEFQKALEYNQNMPDVHYLMAKSYEKLKDFENSIKSLKESFKQLVSMYYVNREQN